MSVFNRVHYSNDLSQSVDHLVRTSRAYSECRMVDPSVYNVSTAGLSFMPHALREARSQSPFEPIRATTPLRYHLRTRFYQLLSSFSSSIISSIYLTFTSCKGFWCKCIVQSINCSNNHLIRWLRFLCCW